MAVTFFYWLSPVGGMAKTYFPGKAAPWNLSSTVKLRRITRTGILDIFPDIVTSYVWR